MPTTMLPQPLTNDSEYDLAAAEARALHVLARPSRPVIPMLQAPSWRWWIAGQIERTLP